MKKKTGKTNKIGGSAKLSKQDLSSDVQRLKENSWTYIRAIVDTVREPFLILDKDLRVISANETFYKTFHVDHIDTENKLVYELGNGQWNLPPLRRLLENILPRNTFFKGFEISHDFPLIGHKVMLLNARRISRKNSTAELFPSVVLLAMEDVTEMMVIAEKFVEHTNELESKILEQTNRLENNINEIRKEMSRLALKVDSG